MRSRAPLALIELLMMIMVFALAAALCLRAFVWADLESAQNADTDMAVLKAQSAAELLKGSGGDYGFAAAELGGALVSGAMYIDQLSPASEQDILLVHYDGEWNASEEAAEYVLMAVPLESSVPGLETARIEVKGFSKEAFTLTVSWQKED